MISKLTCTALSLLRTLEIMATPCSVKAYGKYFRCWPRPRIKVEKCDLKELFSSWVKRNMKSGTQDSFSP
jgi:hypothetical protein